MDLDNLFVSDLSWTPRRPDRRRPLDDPAVGEEGDADDPLNRW